MTWSPCAKVASGAAGAPEEMRPPLNQMHILNGWAWLKPRESQEHRPRRRGWGPGIKAAISFYNLSTSADIKHLCNKQEAQGQLGL